MTASASRSPRWSIDFFMISAFLFLSQIDPDETLVGSQVWDGGGGYTAVMTLLFFMLLVLGLAFFFTKRFGVPRTKRLGSLELLETRPLGGRQFLLVAKYGESRFLLGVCPGRIDYLTELRGDSDDPESDFEEALEKVSKEQ